MAKYNLVYVCKTAIIKMLNDAFATDPDLVADPTFRLKVPKVLDGWAYEMRTFPAVIITSSTAGNRRAGIGDAVEEVFDDNGKQIATKDGGWFDLTLEITVIARNTIERERLIDKVEDYLWYTKKKELLQNCIVVQDIAFGAETEEPYGADYLYVGRATLTLATEWENVIPVETITKLNITETVILPQQINQ